MRSSLPLRCSCGAAALELSGSPIVSVECHCESCRAAGRRLEALPGAPPLLEDNLATRMVLYRKDRVRCLAGAELLAEVRLTPTSKTRRVVTTCCHTPMFLEFSGGHWLSLYTRRWPAGEVPALELRTMVRDAPPGTELSDDVPNARTQSLSFFAKLLGAWIAMGLRAPKLDYVRGSLSAAHSQARS